MRAWGDWEAGMVNLLMLHDNITPPQLYLLQVIRSETADPESSVCSNTFVMKDYAEVLFSAERYKQKIEHMLTYLGKATTNGPSISFRGNCDLVHAFHVLKPLPEIQNWIDRCRGRHWPPIQLLAVARVAPCFLVPAGHPDSDYTHEEWRLSPNLIERMLMFGFNMTQLKCYVILTN
ncbi:hypothetical protein DPMN_046798 [Dreissena polymorpha]|uniref:Uncharacterized protein n=1 Tax=Dreissena polymorpha TaxID=45954 RepID=A0A9D4DAA2_DREPO|nr:hypothetical protein DPMN_046798 [Dreissena polymorpha]